jgi:hypothetical protein
MKQHILLGIALLAFLVPMASAYDYNYYIKQSSSNPDFQLNGYLNVSAISCQTNVMMYADISTGGFWNYQFNFYMNGALNFTNTLSGYGSRTCYFLGNRTIETGLLNATARALSLATPVPVTLYLEFVSTCNVANGTYFVASSDNDTAGYNMYFVDLDLPPYPYDLNATDAWIQIADPSHCSGEAAATAISKAGGDQFIAYEQMWWFMPFHTNNGTTTFTFSNIYSGGYQFHEACGFYDINTNVTGFLSCGSPTTIQLLENSDFVAFVVNYATPGVYLTDRVITVPSMTVNTSASDAYEPNYVCGNWSDCITNYQTRTCYDTKEIFPDIVQTRACLSQNESIQLGFEEYYPMEAYNCIPNTFPLCSLLGFVLVNQSVYYPDLPRWDILPSALPQYFATITSEQATQGSRSLKMWYIPPSPPDRPTFLNATVGCGNLTTGTYPTSSLYGINSSFFVSYNFTFPSTLMALQFDVKTCPTQVDQYNGWCGRECYSFNCSDAPIGDFAVNLYDTLNATNVFLYTGRASANWTTIDVDLNGKVLDGVDYVLNFAVTPLPVNPYTAYGDCVYIDNVKIINRATPIACSQSSVCIGNDKYTQILQGDICISKVYYNDTVCYQQNIQNQYDLILGNQSIFLPINSVTGMIINTTTNQTLGQSIAASGFGFVLIFLTPIFWIMLVITGVMSLVGYFTRHMELGAFAGILMMVAFTMVFPELFWISIVLIVIAGFLVAREVGRAVSG